MSIVSALGRWGVMGLMAASISLGCAVSHESDMEEELAAESTTQETAEAITKSAYKVTLLTPSSLQADKTGTFYFKIRDKKGRAVTSFDVEHTKLFHLVVVSEDLSYFKHLHPTHLGGGVFGVNWKSPEFDQNYHFYAQFEPSGASLQTVLLPVHVPGLVMKMPLPITADEEDMKVSGRNALMIERPTAGFVVGKQHVEFMVHDARTGRPVTDLGTFLGARAHVIAVKADADGKVFEHGHDMGGMVDGGHGGHAGHGGGAASSGSTLSFDLNFASAGLYRLWVQYNRGGTDVTQFFTIEVKKGGGGGCTFAEPGKNYVGKSLEECSRIKFMCVEGTTYFSDRCGCGCQTTAPACDYSDPTKKYVSKSPAECALVLFTCVEGTTTFSNSCGCGCSTTHGGH
jgi:hypothetical protein